MLTFSQFLLEGWYKTPGGLTIQDSTRIGPHQVKFYANILDRPNFNKFGDRRKGSMELNFSVDGHMTKNDHVSHEHKAAIVKHLKNKARQLVRHTSKHYNYSWMAVGDTDKEINQKSRIYRNFMNKAKKQG